MNLKTYIKQQRGIANTVAEELGVTTQSIRDWAKNRVPAERVFGVFKATRGLVTPEEMRPDIYPREHITFKFDFRSFDV